MIELMYDGEIDLAIADSRKSKRWLNQEWLWSKLVNRLKETKRTPETFTEYLAFKKDAQDRIKDVGGYTGGLLNGGQRKLSNVVYRQLLTLDLDTAPIGFWVDFCISFECAAACYSTHKHAPEKPRLRLVIPLDRTVTPEEYEAISRKVADMIGLEYVDPTTHEINRMFYWPSTSIDGAYEFNYQDGVWLSADGVLAEYDNWQDSSEWPRLNSEAENILRLVSTKKKVEDPLDKPGVIGAFCRTYDIHEAIDKFLPEIYEKCDEDNRYSYKQGSTSHGVITYEDKFSYSHHSTDPAGRLLCNAFDLVRIHLFGELDNEKKPHTPSDKTKSFSAMCDYAGSLEAVQEQMQVDRLQSSAGDFGTVDVTEVLEDDKSWTKKLKTDKKGNVFATINNIVVIMENDPYFKDKLAYDDFEKCEVALSDLPWRPITRATRRLIDADDAAIQHYLEHVYKICVPNKYRLAIQVFANRHKFHPVKDYLNGVKWDGKPRLNTLLIEYMGAEDSEYTRAVTRKSLVAAVARIMHPGVKFDYVLTLVGPEGKGKSTLFSALGRDWFSDSFSLHTAGTKESFEAMQGVNIIEIAELAGMAKKEVESVKAFITKRVDRYRVAFGHRVEDFPRQCVFFATTNKRDFLKENNGNRRFWPVQILVQEPTKVVASDLVGDEVDQVWAEAVVVYRKGEKLYLPDSMIEEAVEKQKDHTEVHPWADKIKHYLDLPIPENWDKMENYERSTYVNRNGSTTEETKKKIRTRVCLDAIWDECLGSYKIAIDERSAQIIRSIMSGLAGWEEYAKPTRYGVYGLCRRGYFRIGSPADVPFEVTDKDSVFLN